MFPLLADVCRALLLCAGLVLPGAAWTGALRVPRTLATSFAGSVAGLYLTVLALQSLSIRIGLGSLAIALLAITLAGITVGVWRARSPSPAPPGSSPFAVFRGMGAWSVVYGAFWIIALWRAGHAPLNGPDVEFRWGFLAEQMLAHGNLDFYPARSGADFASYFWAESIPPGVAALHGWAFACAGRFAPAWTVPGVVLQLWAVHELVWHTAEAWAGRNAARCACLALAATPLLTWAILMGQETGFLTLATAGLVYALAGVQRERRAGWAALAGCFALIGAAGREYGIAWLALGALGLLATRANFRAWAAFSLFVAAGALWPLRAFLLTGNPIYSLPFAGAPVNARFVAWLAFNSDALGAPLHGLAGWLTVGRLTAAYSPLAILGWAAIGWTAVVRRAPVALTLLIMVAGVFALWVASVPYTDGGLFYSLRVTTPAAALGALAAGVALASFTGKRWLGPAIASTVIAACVPAMLALPANPWTTRCRAWPAFVAPAPLRQGNDDETVALVRQLASPGVIVTDGAGLPRRFAPAGIRAIPIWSPDVDWLFDSSLPPAEALRRHRASGITHLLIRKLGANFGYLNQCLRPVGARSPFRLVPAGETPLFALFRIEGPPAR